MQRSWIGCINGKYRRFIIWVSNDDLSVLRTDTALFIDATLRITLHPFSQCLIIIAFDLSTNTFVYYVWEFRSAKLDNLYREVRHAIVFQLKRA